ncbi:GIY-YIG nuclease family protein [Candidatus Nomurabacteria bacterium]|nr:GIY-YIG nuclease family protein [Candidatus Nomurabacteria bacterium]
MNHREYYVYIMCNKARGTLYIGVTNNIEVRVQQHQQGKGSVFTAKYQLYRLVYYESFQYIDQAIMREKQLKNWRRQWKINLIEEYNPIWRDLSYEWFYGS